MQKGKLFIISAPSGSGKTTLEKMLLDSGLDLERSISVTTRNPRKTETDKGDYCFVSEDEFSRRKENGEFIEWAKVLDHYYATPKKQIEGALKQGKNVLLSIDVQGTRQIKRFYSEAVRIFIKPPNLKELEKRLKMRKADKPNEIKKRLQLAKQEISQSKMYDYVIINDRIEKALSDLKEIIRTNIKE